jgi:hypothetical protein
MALTSPNTAFNNNIVADGIELLTAGLHAENGHTLAGCPLQLFLT